MEEKRDPLLAALRVEIARRRGGGRLRRVEEITGVRPRRIASGERSLKLAKLPEILAALDIEDVDRWINRRVGPSISFAGILEALPRPRRRPKTIYKLRHALQAARQCRPQPQDIEQIESLNLYRYDDPQQAARQARAMVYRLPESLETTVKAGMAWASALRFRGDLIHCGLVLRELDAYAWLLDRRVEAEYLQRLAPLLRDHFRPSEALGVIRRAEALYLEAGCDVGFGKALIDHGLCLYSSGELMGAQAMARSAMEYLDAGNSRYRSTALMLIGLATKDLSKIHQAEACLAKLHRHDRQTFAYCRAVLATDPREIERYLRQARDHANSGNPFDVALLTLELAELFARQEKLPEAAREIRRAYCLFSPLRIYDAACAALLELARLREHLSPQIIRAAQETIKRARAGLPARS